MRYKPRVWIAAFVLALAAANQGPIVPALGARLSLGLVPGDLEQLYGGRLLPGAFVNLLAHVSAR